MSVQEIQTQIAKLSREEQFQLEAFMKALRLQHSAQFQAELARAATEIESGNKVTADELERRILQNRQGK